MTPEITKMQMQMWHACVTCTYDMVFVFLSENSNTRSLWHAWHVWHACHSKIWHRVHESLGFLDPCEKHDMHFDFIWLLRSPWNAWHAWHTWHAWYAWHTWHVWHAWYIKDLDFWMCVTYIMIFRKNVRCPWHGWHIFFFSEKCPWDIRDIRDMLQFWDFLDPFDPRDMRDICYI